jgi:hypothetical protein
VPLSYLDCRYDIYRYDAREVRLDPGSRHEVPLHYCLSQLNLRYESFGGTFIEPQVYGGGSFAGFDFEGTDQRYQASNLRCRGTPTTGPGVTQGLVVLPLPEAEYTFTPRITALNPGGGTSSVTLQPVEIKLGCRQVVDAWLDFHLGLLAPRSCTAEDEVTLAGKVTGLEPIDRIEYTLNGGPATVHCAPCGVEPEYSITLPLDLGLNVVVITAHGSTGRSAAARSEVERVRVPGPIGNDLRAVREGADARFWWRMAPDSVSTEVWRDAAKAFLRPVRRWIAPEPEVEGVDPGVVPPSAGGMLWFYRVRGLSCGGEPGP